MVDIVMIRVRYSTTGFNSVRISKLIFTRLIIIWNPHFHPLVQNPERKTLTCITLLIKRSGSLLAFYDDTLGV